MSLKRMAAPIVEVLNVYKSYGETVALDGLSIEVQKGEVFGLLGPNGAGKTTLLSILSFLQEPTSGEVRLLGRPLRRGEQELKRNFGLVPQELAIYNELTARENLAFFGELYGVRGAVLRERVDEVLAAIGLQDRADRRAGGYSGGMKRRLNLGAALVHRPALLLLDEPTTGVDPQSRNHIFEEVRRLNAGGVTVIYTTHYMEEVEALCSRIGIIDHGRLIACDSLPGLLRILGGEIRFRVNKVPATLRDRLSRLPDVQVREPGERAFELECRDVKAVLLQLLASLNDLQIDLLGLELEEPNLERVFLHLTGHALRD
jgi:ABC-2 type transport system ATP-binding protein